MKKYLSLLLALCLTLSLAACGGKTDTNADTGDSSQTQDNASTEAPAGEPVELIVFAAASMTETIPPASCSPRSRRARTAICSSPPHPSR